VAYNASDLGARSLVRVVDAAGPLAELRYNASQGLYMQVASAAGSLADAAVGVMVGEGARQGLDLPAVVAATQAEQAAEGAGPGVGAGGGVGAVGGRDVVVVQGGGDTAEGAYEAYG
jgi:hypothetical protein